MRAVGNAVDHRQGQPALGINCVHSENSKLAVIITAAFLSAFGDDLEQELRADFR
jgi:hypothetical protein